MSQVSEIKKPELLSPAGDMERLIMAVEYGADSVYLAGKAFGMRASACNFSDEELIQAVDYAHSHDVKVYVTVNTIPREYELPDLERYILFLKNSGIDAIIAADLGVISIAYRIAPEIPLHVSTQLGVLNSSTASFLASVGADTVVLAREASLEEIRSIRNNTNKSLKLEVFVHGAMCVSFSGRCLLSNYLTNRDANRGECAQPCRWKYHLVEETRPGSYYEITEDNGTFILNSNDMCMIQHIPELIEAGIDCFKIEGRMKSAYYTAIVTNAYRQAIDAAVRGEKLDTAWVNELDMVSHRPYSTGFYFGYPGQNYGESSYSTGADVAAVVEKCESDGTAVLVQRNKFCRGDCLELVAPGKIPEAFYADAMTDEDGNEIDSTPRAMMRFKMRLPSVVDRYSIIRKIR